MKAMHHRRKHGVRASKGSEQERPKLSVAVAALDPDLLNARDVGARTTRRRYGADRPMQVHAAFVAQRRKTRMHLRRNRTRMPPASAILRPQHGLRKPFGDIFDNGE